MITVPKPRPLLPRDCQQEVDDAAINQPLKHHSKQKVTDLTLKTGMFGFGQQCDKV